jgi:hypothetical protein
LLAISPRHAIVSPVASATLNTKHYDNMTTTQIESVSLVLNHKNWTGLSLRELVDAGRIQADSLNIIRDFTKAALGEPKDMDEWHKQREIPAMVVLALQGLAIRKGAA